MNITEHLNGLVPSLRVFEVIFGTPITPVDMPGLTQRVKELGTSNAFSTVAKALHSNKPAAAMENYCIADHVLSFRGTARFLQG